MGLVNKVIPVDQLEAEGVQWASEVLEKSPLAIRCLKSAFNADCDGQSGLQELVECNSIVLFIRRRIRRKKGFPGKTEARF